MEHSWLTLCEGRLDRAISGVLVLWQALWNIAPSEDEERLRFEVFKERTELFKLGVESFDDGQVLPSFRPRYCLLDLVRSLLPETLSERDLEYLAIRTLRHIYNVTCRPDSAHWIYSCTRGLAGFVGKNSTSPIVPSLLIAAIDQTLWKDEQSPTSRALTGSTYLVFLKALGCLLPGDSSGEVRIRHLPDPDWLLGKLFGMPTQIPGFDMLFAGAGLRLVDSAPGAEFSNFEIGGRTILACGPFGSGKSTLTLEVALEVARKGGMSLVVAMEQSVEECLYSLEALGVSTRSPWFDIVDDPSGAIPLVVAPYEGRGAVVFTRIQSEPAHLIETISKRFAWMQQYPLRLLIIDPVNAFGRDFADSTRSARMHLFETAKAKGINLWFTEERHSEGPKQSHFTENLADTVIEIGVHRSTHGHKRRTIEVTKSRLQREEPGQHAFVVQSGQGVRVYASPESLSREAVRFTIGVPQKTRFGAGLDEILGPRSVQAGDIIALQGAAGAARTFIGLQFLFGEDSPSGSRARSSLFLSDAPESKLKSWVELTTRQMKVRAKDVDSIELMSVPPGWLEPGEVLEQVSTRLASLCASRPIDRALVTNIARWESTMPLLAGDSAFATALIGILRNYRVSSVFLIPRIGRAPSSALTEQIRSNADCLIEFDNVDFHGEQRRFLRITQTHDMQHKRGSFEVVHSNHGVLIQSAQSLIRYDLAGTVKPVPIRLFLHSEADRQRSYSAKIAESVEAILSASTIHKQISNYTPELLSLSDSSAIDELHVVQLDEFQVPVTEKEAGFWHPCANRHLKDRVPRLSRRVEKGEAGTPVAVPFYQNISLIAWQSDKLTIPDPTDHDGWRKVAELSDTWEASSVGRDSYFFACPPSYADDRETYNCLFLEILASRKGRPVGGSLLEWLTEEDAVEAALLFRRLCYRFHRSRLSAENSRSQFCNRDGPLVWRCWYNDLAEALREWTPEARARIKVQPLFGEITMAGEWYLAIPRYSAASEIGWQIIDLITSPDAEMSRVCDGIGLPTYSSFYRETGRVSSSMPLGELPIELIGKLVENAFERSALAEYRRVTPILNAGLRRIVDVPSNDRAGESHAGVVRGIVKDLRENIQTLLELTEAS